MDRLKKPAGRQTKIINILRQQNRVSVHELAKSLSISRETVRRDLTALAKVGKVQKFHGGALLPLSNSEGPFGERMRAHVTEKARITTEAVKLISPGETILIDTGSTTLYFAEKLAEIPNLTVITNSSEIASTISLSSKQSQVFLLGGLFNAGNRQTVGNLVVSQMRFFRAHHAILTIGAINAITGLMDFNIEEAQIDQAMIEQAESVTILADNSKFGRIASFKVCGLDRVTNLVCDKVPSEKINSALKEAKVNVICANP